VDSDQSDEFTQCIRLDDAYKLGRLAYFASKVLELFRRPIPPP
jgi:hypothetical protein